MKKFISFTLAFAFVVLGSFAFNNEKVEAATGSTGSCGVSVWTDATNYYSTATTVDFKSSKPSSQCGTVHYKAEVHQVGDGTAYTGVFSTGYFKYSTPIKSFNINTIKRNTPYPQTGKETFRIIVKLYSDSNHSNYIGSARSADFYIH